MTKTTTKANAATKESLPPRRSSCSATTRTTNRGRRDFRPRMPSWSPRPPSSWTSRSMQAATEDLAALAKKLPEGRLYGNGRGFVPNVRQSLYSEIIVTLAVEPQAAVGKDQDELPVATGLPRTWDEIAPGHLVIAQEALDYGWWEAIVLGRTGDMFTLRFRDYPKLPKFVRHRNAIALMSPPAE